MFKGLFATILALGLREVSRMQDSISRLELSHSALMDRMGELLTQMAAQNTLQAAQGKQLDDHAERILYLEQNRTRTKKP